MDLQLFQKACIDDSGQNYRFSYPIQMREQTEFPRGQTGSGLPETKVKFQK